MNILHDGTLDIATGRSRRELHWKNTELAWSQLLARLVEPHRTAETYEDYRSAKKTRQDEIKDIGGFVGGYLAGGRRKPGSVVHRQLLTLDIDEGTSDFWDNFQLLYNCAAGLYSTHKHHPDAPRYRLLIPLDREVFSDEYVAIGRRIAGVLGIEAFDNTTFQPSRLMYWPSCSKDGVYVFEAQDGPWLAADAILATYRDWRDSSAWPVSTRNADLLQHAMKKQGDPLEKPGVIGAFCRMYSISEAIAAFLPDVYEPCEIEGRFTYKEGSTAAGLVTYEDKYAYSHHGTDPVSGKLCNAFDLVRRHKFGLMDEEGDPKETTSNAAMREFARKDAGVVLQIGRERAEEVRVDFGETVEDVVEEVELCATPVTVAPELQNDDWMKELTVDLKGNYQSTIDNIYLILKHDPQLRDKLYFDEFEARLIVKRELPWRKVTRQTRDFTDDDFDCLAHYLEMWKMPFTHAAKALAKIRTECKTHPVRDYLNGLKWDGKHRLDSLFVDYLGARDDPYTRSATRKTFIAAVARVFEPGIKFDTVLTLVGKEGIGKSTVIAKMAQQWFSDCLGDIHTKEGMESLRGVWIMEIAELATFRRAEQEAIKRFLSSREDIYRPAYGKQQVKFPRQCIFFATTNKEDFLTGSHGNRRFLPVATHITSPAKDVFRHLLQSEIDQLWAEAVEYYNNGESLDLDEETKVLAEQVRERHNEVDDRAGLIERYLNTLLPENWEELTLFERRAHLSNEDGLQAVGTIQRTKVCAAEIWCEALGGMHKDMTQANTKYIHDILRKMKDWVPAGRLRFKLYGTQRVHTREQRLKAVFTVFTAPENGVNTVNGNVNRN